MDFVCSSVQIVTAKYTRPYEKLDCSPVHPDLPRDNSMCCRRMDWYGFCSFLHSTVDFPFIFLRSMRPTGVPK